MRSLIFQQLTLQYHAVSIFPLHTSVSQSTEAVILPGSPGYALYPSAQVARTRSDSKLVGWQALLEISRYAIFLLSPHNLTVPG